MKTSKISKEIPRKVEPQIKINRKKTPKEITNRIQEIEYVDPATGERHPQKKETKYQLAFTCLTGNTSKKKSISISGHLH